VSLTPSLGQLLSDLEAAIKGSMSTALPATVVTYNPLTQTITAKPSISARFSEPTSGALVPVPLPAIANVPVAFPKGGLGLYSITWPLISGDEVVLVMSDRSMDEWKSTGLPENIPVDSRRFDLTDAIAFPAGTTLARSIPPSGVGSGLVISAPSIQAGSSAAIAPVALQPGLFIELQRISAAILALGGSYVPGISPAPNPVGDPTVAASLKVKAE